MNERLGYFGLNLPEDLVFMQTALQYFFDHAVLPVYSGDTMINLMEYFPLLKQGYAFKQTIINLLYAYIEVHKLLDPNNQPNNQHFIIPNILMDEAFNGNIPAFWYDYNEITMEDAVSKNLTPDYLNTFQVSLGHHAVLNPKHIPTYQIYQIIDSNSQNVTELPGSDVIIYDESMINAIIDESMINAIIDERSLAFEIENIIEFLPEVEVSQERITFTNILKNLHNFNIDDLIDRLLADDRTNKLIYAIFIQDPNMVNQYLQIYDPRDNNYEAYHLAMYYLEKEQVHMRDSSDFYLEQERKNFQQIIVDMIKAVIIKRNLLEQKTFQTMMTPIGESDLPQTEILRQYSRSLVNK